ncbi:hypothetical protein GGTG_04901 [Gaeumannomyces tritici R3-111a-1]|uniref:Uncharacterized protein n=1 Tax=Gaeumannomyces tritici (strain R3-111a-1) TaxID=644352 RepID=J3NUE5_GAET3|nr:hypothetical protein GGTG_04901 [Gaeumannomyces tritici R3-111a-1]EJT79818.1 hypothetical protein GGTG_04901 [Gaeumannomyces tritici R3-111a-1]
MANKNNNMASKDNNMANKDNKVASPAQELASEATAKEAASPSLSPDELASLLSLWPDEIDQLVPTALAAQARRRKQAGVELKRQRDANKESAIVQKVPLNHPDEITVT